MTTTQRVLIYALSVLALAGTASAGGSVDPLDFMYQGELLDGGNPVNGNYDFQFRLYDAPTGGSQLAPEQQINNVPVEDGRFTLPMSFFDVFIEVDLPPWLEIGTRPSGPGGFTTLAPRQPITAAPRAVAAQGAAGSFRIQDLPATNAPSRLLFGPTDDCSIGIDPVITGLILRDPVIRILPPIAESPRRLIFGPTDLCTIEVDPAGPSGLQLRDPGGIRILPPAPASPRLLFGPTDDCSIGIDPAFPGLIVRDPGGIRALNPNPMLPTRLLFGPTDDCSIGIDPGITGLIERDPVGFRLLGGNRLIFGPTDDCSISIDPAIPGLLMYDPAGIRVCNPIPGVPFRILFGPTEGCTISVNPLAPAMTFSDPNGFRFMGGRIGVNVPNPTFGIQLPNGPGIQNQGFANAWINASSRRWKQNIRPIENALDTISRLQGVSFDWTAEMGGRRDVGLVAEDVAEVLPEVVSWDEKEHSAHGINYDHIVAVAVEGIKQQQAQIKDLGDQNAALQRDLAAMRAQMKAMAAQLDEFSRTADGGE